MGILVIIFKRREAIISLLTFIINPFFRYRYQRYLRGNASLQKSQNKLLLKMLKQSRGTRIYQDLQLDRVKSLEEFNRLIHGLSYGFYKPYVIDTMKGQPSVLFHGKTEFVAVTSGTTSNDMNYNGRRIPYNKAMIGLYKQFIYALIGKLLQHVPNFNVIKNGWLAYGTYTDPSHKNEFGVNEGYISGYLNGGVVTRLFMEAPVYPAKEILMIDDWDEKIEQLLDTCVIKKNIRFAQGIPSYLLHIFDKAEQRFGKGALGKLWPALEFIHYSGTSIEKFKSRFDQLFGRKLKYFGSYIATEGALGMMQDIDGNGLILNLESVVYSFADTEKGSERLLALHEIAENRCYRVHITTPNGFFQYDLGDYLTMHLDNGYPVFTIKGRSNAAMNIAAEKVTEDFANRVVSLAARDFDIRISHYFLYPAQNQDGIDIYEWALIPDRECPALLPAEFAMHLDKHLMDLSGDYKDCRLASKVIGQPRVKFLPAQIEREYFQKFHAHGQLKMRHFFTDKNEVIALITKIAPHHVKLMAE